MTTDLLDRPTVDDTDYDSKLCHQVCVDCNPQYTLCGININDLPGEECLDGPYCTHPKCIVCYDLGATHECC